MQNQWAIGELYPSGGLNNVKWSQPGGPGTLVYPQQQLGGEYLEIKPFNEFSGIFTAGCGHSQDEALIQREYDYVNQTSVALICCQLCGYVQYTLSPFEAALDTVFHTITII